MPKTILAGEDSCDYEFLLKPIETLYKPRFPEVSFSLKIFKGKRGKKIRKVKPWPVFNTDGLYYTPAFVVDVDGNVRTILE